MPSRMSGKFPHSSLKFEAVAQRRNVPSLRGPLPISSSQLAGNYGDGVVDLVGAAVAGILRETLERAQRPAAVRGGNRALMWRRSAAALGVEFVGAVAHHLPDPARLAAA